ncbi:MAG: four helix bundle protein [Bacteroidaceae bacterium]|nr:four helix bundle protein [Bacteroidaceae bacterium]
MNETVKYDFRRLEAYVYGKELVKQVYLLIDLFPKSEQFALCDQLRRAIISVPSNIAEGLGRFSDKEKVHFLEIAYGSLMEAQCQLDIACDLGYFSKETHQMIDTVIDREARLISGLRAKYVKSDK